MRSAFRSAIRSAIRAPLRREVVAAEAVTPRYLINNASGLTAYSSLSATRNSERWYYDSAGILRQAPLNLIYPSEDIDTLFGTKTNAALVETGTAPSSTTQPVPARCWELRDDAVGGSGFSNITQNITLVANESNTYSFFAQAGSLNWFALYAAAYTSPANGGVRFNLSGAGAVGNEDTGITGTIEAIDDDWFRCAITFTLGADAVGALRVYLCDGDSNYSVANRDGTNYIYIAGAQGSKSVPTALTDSAQPTGLYAKTVASSNSAMPVEYDPADDSLLGVPIGPDATNNCLATDDLSNATYWTPGDAVIDAAAGTAPNGTATAFRLNVDATAATHELFNVTDYTTLTSQAVHSVVVQNEGEQYAFICLWNDATNYYTAVADLTALTITATSTGGGGTPTGSESGVIDIGGSRRLIWATSDLTVDTKKIIFGAAGDAVPGAYSAGRPTFTAVAGEDLLFWNPQATAGSRPYEPIPNSSTSAAVTRVADDISITDLSDIGFPTNGMPFSIYSKFTTSKDMPSGTSQSLYNVYQNTIRYLYTSIHNTLTRLQSSSIPGGADDRVAQYVLVMEADTTSYSAQRWAVDDFATTANGDALRTDPSCNDMAANPPTEFQIGHRNNGAQWNGHIAEMFIRANADTDAQLEAYSTDGTLP